MHVNLLGPLLPVKSFKSILQEFQVFTFIVVVFSLYLRMVMVWSEVTTCQCFWNFQLDCRRHPSKYSIVLFVTDFCFRLTAVVSQGSL